MVRPEVVRQWRLEKAVRIVKKAVQDFSASGHDQVNLAADAAQHNLTQQIVSELDLAGLIRGFPETGSKSLER